MPTRGRRSGTSRKRGVPGTADVARIGIELQTGHRDPRKTASREETMALNIAAEKPRTMADRYWDKGYAIVRGLFTKAEMVEIQARSARIYAEGLKHHAGYRHKNLYYEILAEAYSGKRHMLQAHWFSWISPLFEKFRRDPRYLQVLEPLLGRSIKQPAQSDPLEAAGRRADRLPLPARICASASAAAPTGT